MTPLRRFVEDDRQIRLLRQRAEPFTDFANNTTDAPIRQFEIDQRDRRIGLRTCLNQVIELSRLPLAEAKKVACNARSPAGTPQDDCEGVSRNASANRPKSCSVLRILRPLVSSSIWW